MTSDAVRRAAAAPDLNHRDPEYQNLVREVRERLLAVYPATREGWHPFLLGGSGTAAVEAMVTSCIRTGPVLVIANGYYSGRIVEILEVHRIPHRVLSFDWEAPIEIAAVERALANEAFEAILMTHHETTLGRLNPVGELAALAARHGVRCLVDAMSSFGADDLDFTHVDALASSANKCLHGLPGVSFVLAREGVADGPRRSYYLHLPMYAGENPPLTPPVPTLQAFREALRENPAGHGNRFQDYAAKMARLRKGLADRGFSFAVPEVESSVTLVSPSLPDGWSFDRWFQANYERGYVLYGTKAHLRERFFQASIMGEVTLAQVDAWLGVVDALL
jgi:2-aminoethylphosphonate-pyruvate transaminase